MVPQRVQLARINADGTGHGLVGAGLPEPSLPAWSKDGRVLALTSPHPERPNKVSRGVFLFDPAAGSTRLAVGFEDRVDVEPVTQRNRFGYVLPLFKAFSPDRIRIVVSSMFHVGFCQTTTPALVDTLSGQSASTAGPGWGDGRLDAGAGSAFAQ